MTALKKCRWRVWGSEIKARLSYLEGVSPDQGYTVSKSITQSDVFQCILLMPLYIFKVRLIYLFHMLVAIQFFMSLYKYHLSRASTENTCFLQCFTFFNISHFNEIYLTFVVTSHILVNCFFYCEDIFQFAYFCFDVFVFKWDPKIF